MVNSAQKKYDIHASGNCIECLAFSFFIDTLIQQVLKNKPLLFWNNLYTISDI